MALVMQWATNGWLVETKWGQTPGNGPHSHTQPQPPVHTATTTGTAEANTHEAVPTAVAAVVQRPSTAPGTHRIVVHDRGSHSHAALQSITPAGSNIVLARTRRLALRCKRRDERAPQLEVCAQHLLVVLVVVVQAELGVRVR